MRLVSIVFLLGVFFFSLASVTAFEFDNAKSYDGNSRTATVTNAFGFGERLARITLQSPDIVYVAPGEDRLVAWYELENFHDYDGRAVFDEIELYNKKNAFASIDREITFKVQETIIIPDKACSLTAQRHGNNSFVMECLPTTKPIHVWRELDETKFLEAGTYIIGLFTEVKRGDSVEWIPNTYGVRIDEWAGWDSDLSILIQSYYTMNATAGDERDWVSGTNNLTTFTNTRGEVGIINSSHQFSGAAGQTAETMQLQGLASPNGTIAFWVNFTGVFVGGNTDYVVWGLYDTGSAGQRMLRINFNMLDAVREVEMEAIVGGTTQWKWETQADFLDAGIERGNWTHVAFVHNGTDVIFYVNNETKGSPLYTDTTDKTVWMEGVINDGANLMSFGANRDNNVNNLNYLGSIDEVGIWNRSLSKDEMEALYNNGTGITFDNLGVGAASITVALEQPPDSLITTLDILDFNGTVTPTNANITNATLWVWNVTSIYSNNLTNWLGNSTVVNNTNYTLGTIRIGTYNWNIWGCVVDGSDSTANVCDFAGANRSFTRNPVTTRSQIYSPLTWETKNETFIEEVTLGAGFNISSVDLIWNGSTRGGNFSLISGQNYSMSHIFDIPAGSNSSGGGHGAINFTWNITFTDGTSATTNETQTNVNAINWSQCIYPSEPFNTTFINFTFQDENLLATRTANIDASTWTFWLGSGAENKSYTYANTTAPNINYPFCFNPGNNTVYTDLTLRYSNESYPQRTFTLDQEPLTSSTRNQILYLLSTADGIYSSIQVTETAGTPISGVQVTMERQIAGVFVVIGRTNTGSDGISTFWVNPNFPHRITAVKTGFQTAQVTITPSQTLYSLILAKSDEGATFTGSLEGLTWNTFPPSGFLAPGNYTFYFNITAGLVNLDGSYCRLDLVNSSSGAVVATATGSDSASIANASFCHVPINYTHYLGERIFGSLYVDTTNTTGFILIDSDQRWSDIEGTDVNVGTTIWSFFTELRDLDEWGEGTHRQEWNRIVLFFLSITLFVGLFSYFTQWDASYPGAAILLIWIVILLASFSGWFILGLDPLTNQNLQIFDKYVVAYICTMFTAGWYFHQLRRQ